MDLDNFKLLNDKKGHAQGDKLLVLFSERLVQSFGQENCYRIGGDEFVVLLEKYMEPAQIQNAKQELVMPLGEYQVGVSIGQYKTNKNESPEQWIHFADLAMYKDKRI